MTRADRLRLPDTDYQLESSLHYINGALTSKGFGPPDNVYGQARQVIGESRLAVVGCILEDRLDEARHYAKMCVKWTLEYFFGQWRSVPQRVIRERGEAELRRSLSYAREYLDGVRMCGLLGDWDSVKKLSTYPDRQLCHPVDAETLEENAYVYLLCSFPLADFHVSEENEDLVFIRSRRSKLFKLLAALVVDVSRRDSEAFNRDLDEYLKFFKKRQFRQDIPRMQCQDGTFWINCARHVKMSPEWKNEYDDLLMFL